jgi:hypothetical protein
MYLAMSSIPISSTRGSSSDTRSQNGGVTYRWYYLRRQLSDLHFMQGIHCGSAPPPFPPPPGVSCHICAGSNSSELPKDP